MSCLWPFGRRKKKQRAQAEATVTVTYTIAPTVGTTRTMVPDDTLRVSDSWTLATSPKSVKTHFALWEKLEAAPASKQESIAKDMVRQAPDAAKGFRKAGWEDLPTHGGFRRLAINAEKAKDYRTAISVSQEAMRQGWAGDWEKRIERCQAKLAKAG